MMPGFTEIKLLPPPPTPPELRNGKFGLLAGYIREGHVVQQANTMTLVKEINDLCSHLDAAVGGWGIDMEEITRLQKEQQRYILTRRRSDKEIDCIVAKQAEHQKYIDGRKARSEAKAEEKKRRDARLRVGLAAAGASGALGGGALFTYILPLLARFLGA